MGMIAAVKELDILSSLKGEHGRHGQRRRWEVRSSLRMFGMGGYCGRRNDRAFGGKLNKRLVDDPRPALKPAQMRDLAASK